MLLLSIYMLILGLIIAFVKGANDRNEDYDAI